MPRIYHLVRLEVGQAWILAPLEVRVEAERIFDNLAQLARFVVVHTTRTPHQMHFAAVPHYWGEDVACVRAIYFSTVRQLVAQFRQCMLGIHVVEIGYERRCCHVPAAGIAWRIGGGERACEKTVRDAQAVPVLGAVGTTAEFVGYQRTHSLRPQLFVDTGGYD